jgi:acetate kinase
MSVAAPQRKGRPTRPPLEPEKTMKILVLNTGSSTIKFSTIESESEQVLLDGQADWSRHPAQLILRPAGAEPIISALEATGHSAAIAHILTQLHEQGAGIAAVGHRIVHGGPVYTTSVLITAEVKARLAEMSDLAPLHMPINLEGIEAAQSAWPHVPHVAVFDTAFHATLSEAARTYPIPYAWTHDWRLRRYGFHGLSHAYCADRAARLLGRGPAGLRLVICHLGNGCSMSAVRDGVCVDTSMGLTPLEGLMMGTRSGSVDPSLLLYVLRHKGLKVEDMDRVLNSESGLLGVSGVSGDMRQVQEAAQSGNARAALALDIYVHRLRQMIGAMAATLGGVDALVFTAGVGEHSASIRAAACRGLECLGLEIDADANVRCHPDADVAAPSSRGRILVIATREDLTIVRETVRVLQGGAKR